MRLDHITLPSEVIPLLGFNLCMLYISGKMSIENQNNRLAVTRGVQNAPCTGYAKYDVGGGDRRRICAASGGDFHETIAQRLCFTLGLDLDRKQGQSEGVRLYK